MENTMFEHKSEAHLARSFAAGLLLGGLVSTAVALLLAPQSGEKTRALIVNKSKELREQTVETVDGVKRQINTKAHQIADAVHDKAETLQHRGQEVLDKQKERLSAIVESGNAIVKEYLE